MAAGMDVAHFDRHEYHDGFAVASMTRASETLRRSGWLQTGDIAVIDKDGYVKIAERLRDLIKSCEERFSSRPIESLIQRLSAVAEAAVIGLLPRILMSDRHVVRGDEPLQDHVHRGITSTPGVTGGSVFDERRFMTLDELFSRLQSEPTAN